MDNPEILSVLREIRDELKFAREERERRMQSRDQFREEMLEASKNQRSIHRSMFVAAILTVVCLFALMVGANVVAEWIRPYF